MDITSPPPYPVLEPLEVTCTSSQCEEGLHCFKPTRKMKLHGDFGKCRSCGVDFIDWGRLYINNPNDAEYTFDALKHELVRHVFNYADIDLKTENHARRKGILELENAAYKRLSKYVGPANPYRDGMQTPKSGNIVYFAQHFTASCCRKCMEYWHGIPYGIELTNQEKDYFTHLIMLFIMKRLPALTKNGEKIPPIRTV